MREHLCDFGLSFICERYIYKFVLNKKRKKLPIQEIHCKGNEEESQRWGEIFAKHLSRKELECKIYK